MCAYDFNSDNRLSNGFADQHNSAASTLLLLNLYLISVYFLHFFSLSASSFIDPIYTLLLLGLISN